MAVIVSLTQTHAKTLSLVAILLNNFELYIHSCQDWAILLLDVCIITLVLFYVTSNAVHQVSATQLVDCRLGPT